MTEPLTAGERLAPRSRTGKPPKPPRREPAAASRVRRAPVGRCARWAACSACCSGLPCWWPAWRAVGGYVAYQRFAADLPDVEGLRHYQPRVMSRVYAGNSRLLSELATERRIFVPVRRHPRHRQARLLSAEDQNFFIHRGVDPIAIAARRGHRRDELRPGTPADRRLHHHPAGGQEHTARQCRGVDAPARRARRSWRSGWRRRSARSASSSCT